MSETLLQAAAAAAAQRRRRLLLRAAASERVCFIPVPKPEYYSLRQGKEERGREGGSREERGRQQGGGRQGAERDGGSVQREAGEAPGERGAKRREGRRGRARRRREARGPPAPGPGRCAAPQPPPHPAPLRSGPGPGAHCLRVRAAGRRTQSAVAREPGTGGLGAVRPRSFPGLEPRDERVRPSPGAGGSWLGARRG